MSIYKDLKYAVDFIDGPPELIRNRSNRYRFLRDALNKMEPDQWLKVTVTSENAITNVESVVGMVRSAVYNWRDGAEIRKRGLNTATVTDRVDDHHVDVYVTIQHA